MLYRFPLIICLFSSLLLAACGGSNADPLPEDLGDCPEESAIAWSSVEAIFADNCTRCHSSELTGASRRAATEGYDYDSAAAANGDPEWTWERIAKGQMPNDSGFSSDADALLVREWLACGGPE